jgi:transcription elongation GreA/GreB family factor
MAKALAGTKAGSRVRVPTSSGYDVEVEIAAVTALPEHIKAWING